MEVKNGPNGVAAIEVAMAFSGQPRCSVVSVLSGAILKVMRWALRSAEQDSLRGLDK